MFVPGKPFQPNLMLAGKVRLYPNEAHFSCFTLWQALGLAHKHKNRLERLAKDKYSSFYENSLIRGEKKFYKTDT